MELIIEDLSKKFKDKEAVSHVSLKLTPGIYGSAERPAEKEK